MITRTEIKRKLMQEALESGEVGIASSLIYANAVAKINEWELPSESFRLVVIYTRNEDLKRVLKYIDNPNVLVEDGDIEVAYKQAVLETDIKHLVILAIIKPTLLHLGILEFKHDHQL